MWTFDLETEAISGNTSKYPPKPVGLAFSDPNMQTGYVTSHEEMKRTLAKGWDGQMLFHGGKFDVSVAMKWFELPPPEPLNIQDTMYQVFLHDPHAPSLALKESAEYILKEPPTERNDLRDWILRNVPGATKKEWGAYICKAPVEIVRPYAIGDVTRTRNLHNHLMPRIEKSGMLAAYQREQRLMPIMYSAEERGLRVDIPRLEKDIEWMEKWLYEVHAALRTRLGDINFDSPAELQGALERADAMSAWMLTPKGARSVAKVSLKAGIKDPQLLALLLYRGSLTTALETFARPWMLQALASGGRLHPNWNQVRQTDSGGFKGTRTGRFSCDHPNLTNPMSEVKDKEPEGFPPIPLMRCYLLPEEGHKWLKRDFSSQEIRILAHYEDDALMRAYQADANLDPHQMAQGLIKSITGIELDRKYVKITAFSTIYGAGVTGLSEQLGIPYAQAKEIREGYMAAIPGIRVLSNALRNRGRAGLPMKTLGGRLYLPEPPRMINGGMRTFEYKLLNYLIQGSAADQTKEAILDWQATAPRTHLFLAALHDEMDISVPVDDVKRGMEVLQAAMNKPRLDVPVLSEGFIGDNFGELNAFTLES